VQCDIGRGKRPRFFNKIKHCRRVATRYEKLAANDLAFVSLLPYGLWLRVNRVHVLDVVPWPALFAIPDHDLAGCKNMSLHGLDNRCPPGLGGIQPELLVEREDLKVIGMVRPRRRIGPSVAG
jgi:hypothetical protein